MIENYSNKVQLFYDTFTDLSVVHEQYLLFPVHLSELFLPAVVCCLWTTDIWSDPDLHYR